jgi:hypothetical protein
MRTQMPGPKLEMVAGIVSRAKKRQASNMVEMRMGEEQVAEMSVSAAQQFIAEAT